jgi:hypothetical protein
MECLTPDSLALLILFSAPAILFAQGDELGKLT